MDKIAKLLNLSKSDNDNEALAAIRLANKRLAEKGLSWDVVLLPKPKTLSVSGYKPPYNEDDENHEALMEIFEIVLEKARGKTQEFVASVYKQYKQTGRLSPKQLDILMKIYKQ